MSILRKVGTPVMKKTISFYILFSFAFLSISCTELEELASEDGGEVTDETVATAPTQDNTPYSITNEFQDHAGINSSVYIHLASTTTKKTYIIPPTNYKAVELERIIIDDAKVDGKCVTVPAEDFPVLVSVCQTAECTAIRPLNVLLKKPAHYNISGIGGLLVPQVYPVSPCSEDFVKLMQTVEDYTQL